MALVVVTSIALGLAWNAIVVRLMGGRLKDAFEPGWLAGGALAGLAAGLFTVWSRRRREGRERVRDVFATYYLGMVVYWLGIVVIQRIVMCVRHGGWTDFNLGDHFRLILLFLGYGTLFYGIVLIPLAYLSRWVIWKAYRRGG